MGKGKRLRSKRRTQGIPVVLFGHTGKLVSRIIETRIHDGVTAYICFTEGELLRRLRRAERARILLAGRFQNATSIGDQHALAGGCFLARAAEHYLAALILLKRSEGHTAWGQLIDAQERLHSASKFPILIKDVKPLEVLVARIEGMLTTCFPKPIFNSIGYEMDDKICTICGQSILDCVHEPGRLYGGKMCNMSPVNLRVRELSLVEKPHNRRAVIVETDFDGKKTDVFAGTTVAGAHPDVPRKRHGTYRSVIATVSLSDDISNWHSLESTLP